MKPPSFPQRPLHRQWTRRLTSSNLPGIADIEAKTAGIGKLNGAARVNFIRTVNEASKLLTGEQCKIPIGFALPAPAAMAPMPGM